MRWEDRRGFLDLVELAFQDCEQDRDEDGGWTPQRIAECKRKQRAVLTHLGDNLLRLDMNVSIVRRDRSQLTLTVEIDGWDEAQVEHTVDVERNQRHLLVAMPRRWWLSDNGEAYDFRPIPMVVAARTTVQLTAEQWEGLKVDEPEATSTQCALGAEVVFKPRSVVNRMAEPFSTKVGQRRLQHRPHIQGLLVGVVAWRLLVRDSAGGCPASVLRTSVGQQAAD